METSNLISSPQILLLPSTNRGEKTFNTHRLSDEQSSVGFMLQWSVSCLLYGYNESGKKIYEVVKNWTQDCYTWAKPNAEYIDIDQTRKIEKCSVLTRESDWRLYRDVEFYFRNEASISVRPATIVTSRSPKQFVGVFSDTNSDIEIQKLDLILDQSLDMISLNENSPSRLARFPFSPLFHKSYNIKWDSDSEENEEEGEIGDENKNVDMTEAVPEDKIT